MVAPTKYTLSLTLFAPAAATANLFLWSETPFVCLRYFRRRENTFTFVSAQAIVQLVYLTQARGEAEAPKTGLVAHTSEHYDLFGETVCSLTHFRRAEMHPLFE